MARDLATTKDNLPVGSEGGVDGLEDVGASDVLLPIIKIDHKAGVFVDSLSNETFESFDGVMLGLVKGRVMWPSEIGEEGMMPVCRSLDHSHGRPSDEFNMKDPSKKIPAKVSGFSEKAVKVAIAETKKGPAADEDKLLLCGDCGLAEWESMPGSKTPWCSEQFTFPVLRITEDGGFAPAYITFQRASIKACKAYISSFRQAQRPMYTVRTNIKAIHQKRGNVEYVTPQFTKGEGTDPSDWPEFSENFADIRSFLKTARVRDDDTDTDTDDDDETTEVIDTTAADVEPDDDDDDDEPDTEQTDPESAAAANDDDDDDEEPF